MAASSPPRVLVGTWEGQTESFIQKWCQGGKFPVTFELHEDRTVEGRAGDATFHNASFRRNRGWLGRMLNLASDYIIEADLGGFLTGGVQCGKVSIFLRDLDEVGWRASVECSECVSGGERHRWITARDVIFYQVGDNGNPKPRCLR